MIATSILDQNYRITLVCSIPNLYLKVGFTPNNFFVTLIDIPFSLSSNSYFYTMYIYFRTSKMLLQTTAYPYYCYALFMDRLALPSKHTKNNFQFVNLSSPQCRKCLLRGDGEGQILECFSCLGNPETYAFNIVELWIRVAQ